MHFYGNATLFAEGIGITGFCLYVTTYALLTFRFLSGNSVYYFALNLTAASCVLVGLTASFNLASALIQIFRISMSIIGITLRLARG
jgi:hypothetical protein